MCAIFMTLPPKLWRPPVLCDTTNFGSKRYQYFQEGNFETNTNTNTTDLKNSIPIPIPIPLIQKIRYQYQYQYSRP